MEEREDIYIDKITRQKKTLRFICIILILIIILMIVLHIFLCKAGRIGYEPTGAETIIPEIEAKQGDLSITKDTKLDIFKNIKFNNQKIIAPASSGKYEFSIKNETESNICYDISFTDEMKEFVNMKFKLKLDNVYIRGSENESVFLKDLNVENITVTKGSNNIYTLEWEWEDSDDKDTYVGIKQREAEQYYKLNLKIQAKEYAKEQV